MTSESASRGLLRLSMESSPRFRGRTFTSGDWGARQNVQLLGLKDRDSFIHSFSHSLTIYGAFIICQALDEALAICS